MCGWPVGGNPCPGGAQWTPRGPTTGLTTLKHVHPALLSSPALRPPEPLAVASGMAKASPAAAMSGITNRRISPLSRDDRSLSIRERPGNSFAPLNTTQRTLGQNHRARAALGQGQAVAEAQPPWATRGTKWGTKRYLPP